MTTGTCSDASDRCSCEQSKFKSSMQHFLIRFIHSSPFFPPVTVGKTGKLK